MSIRTFLPCAQLAAALLLFAGSARAAIYHVDVKTGDDTRDGATATTAWKTLNHACERVEAGDTVTVHPGVYFEHVRLKKAGTAEKPIRFAADAIEKNRVVITGAERGLRERRGVWGLEDQQHQIVYTRLSFRPARVLSDEVDLFPYPSLAELTSFTLKGSIPGPRHGFAYDEKSGKLFVRLHQKYGSIDPSEHLMKVGPESGEGTASRHLESELHYNFGVLADGPAHVVLEGFTFETPGICGVFVKGGHVTVRHSWFLGCRAGVSGNSDSDLARQTNDVTIERCDYSQFPAYHDVEEMLALAKPAGAKSGKLPPYFWNVRSGNPQTYELGIALKVGARWKILRNYIHDAIDGISHWSVTSARDLEVGYNTFDRLIGNAVESGDHSAGIRVHHSFIKDVFQPFSWNPKDGTPWPGPMLIDHNVVTSSSGGRKLWAAMKTVPGCFHIGCGDVNWSAPRMKEVPANAVAVPAAGFVAYNNTILFSTGRVFDFAGVQKRKLQGFRFLNNLVVSRAFADRDYREADLSGFNFNGNLVAPGDDQGPGPGKRFAGPLGRVLEDYSKLGLVDLAKRNFAPAPDSPALGGGIAGVDLPDFSADAGAYPRGASGRHELTGPQLTAPAKSP